MRFVPHLIFDGQCETAFRFYERTLDGNLVTLLTYGGSAMAEQLPREWREKIVHANLTVDDTELVGADAFPGQYQRPQGFYVLLELSGPERTEQIFPALAQDVVVLMPWFRRRFVGFPFTRVPPRPRGKKRRTVLFGVMGQQPASGAMFEPV